MDRFLVFDYRHNPSRKLTLNTQPSFRYYTTRPLGNGKASIIFVSYFGKIVLCFEVVFVTRIAVYNLSCGSCISSFVAAVKPRRRCFGQHVLLPVD